MSFRGRLTLGDLIEDMCCCKNSPIFSNNSGESVEGSGVGFGGIGEDSASSGDFSSSEESEGSAGRLALFEVRFVPLGTTLGGIT